MRRYLVVAHQTLGSAELHDALRDRLAQGPSSFHLVVPFLHGGAGALWTEGEARHLAAEDLEQARMRFTAEGFPVTGEVGDANPVLAVSDVMIRAGVDAFDEIIISTLPLGISKWVHMDVPARVTRSTIKPVTHVVAVHANA
jgi:GABA permease